MRHEPPAWGKRGYRPGHPIGRDEARIALAERLDALSLSPPDDPLAFESRLADENNWTLGYALRVGREYRRHLVLAQAATPAPRPSADVEAAWRLHRSFTADHARLCHAVFGAVVDPDVLAARDDDATRASGHDATLKRYAAVFGAPAPADVWPGHVRPARAASAVHPWRLPGLLRPGWRLFWASTVLALVLGWWLPRHEVLWRVMAVNGYVFLGGMAAACVGLWKLMRRSPGPGRMRIGGIDDLMLRFRDAPGVDARDALDPYETAWLLGGYDRMAAVALAMQVQRGDVIVEVLGVKAGRSEGRWRVVDAAVAGVHPVERALMRAGRGGGSLDARAAVAAVRPLGRATGRRLRRTGLALERDAFGTRRLLLLACTLGLLVLMLMRVSYEWPPVNDDAEGMIALAGTSAVGIWLFFLGFVVWEPARTSDTGDAALRDTDADRAARSGERAKTLANLPESEREAAAATLPVDAMTLARFGGSAVAHDPRFQAFQTFWAYTISWRSQGVVPGVDDIAPVDD